MKRQRPGQVVQVVEANSVIVYVSHELFLHYSDTESVQSEDLCTLGTVVLHTGDADYGCKLLQGFRHIYQRADITRTWN